jgi:urea transport system ATP-binding protein
MFIWGAPMLDVQNLSLKYGQSQILYDVSFNAPVGQVTTVMGTNGVGKTSLLRALSGRHGYIAGQITLDGHSLDHPSANVAARRGIAYVPQGREVFALMSVAENLETGFACLPKGEHHVPDWIFELFPVLLDMKDRRGGDLSGGQQQQLAIARALITKPKVLLLDEPTEGIQPNVIQQIGAAIARLRARGDMAIVLVEQNVNFAHRAADHFVMMKRGAVCRRMTKAECSRTDLVDALAL